jgi:hypothetical protein
MILFLGLYVSLQIKLLIESSNPTIIAMVVLGCIIESLIYVAIIVSNEIMVELARKNMFCKIL